MTLEEFKIRFEHKPTEIYPFKPQKDVLVSICVVTYNQANFIGQCLDSILSQKTNFSFEILLGDDASKDGTSEICKEYANKYPDKIRLFLHHRENNIKIASRPTGRFNFLYNLLSASGKYISLCEGDDFWIDPYKLQKQVDFLETNEDYILTHSDVNIYVENLKKSYPSINKIKHRQIKSGEVFLEKLRSNFRIFTCTTLFRNCDDLITVSDEYEVFAQADLILFLELAKKGLFKYFDEPMGTYRVNNKSMTQSGNSIQNLLFKQSSLNIRLKIAKKYHAEPSIIEKLNIELNKLMIESAYLDNNAELMKETLKFLNEKGVLLNRRQQYKTSIVLGKGITPIINKMILDVSDAKSKIVGKLSDYKNKYVIK